MWSPYYKYYQIRKDKLYSELVDTEIVTSMILKNENILSNGKLSFKSKKDCPGISITIIKTNDGNYGIKESTHFSEINLIEVITSGSNESDEEWFLGFLRGISNKLNWKIILEEDDDGNEEVLIK